MKRAGKLFLFSMVMLSKAAVAHADAQLECRTTGSFSWGCRVVQSEVSRPLNYRGELVDTSYKIEYRLDCPGHNMNLVLRAGQKEEALRQGADIGLVVVEGANAIELVDSNPRRTRRLIFQGACEFETVSVTRSPSSNSLEVWGHQALSQAKTLQHVQSLYLLATDYESLDSWNQIRLEQVRDRLETLVERFPGTVHYKVLLRTVRSALEAAPEPVGAQDVANAAQSMAQEYREELEKELAAAREMVDRFQHFKLAVQQDLEDVLNEVAGAVQ